jgi:hypothetical protein
MLAASSARVARSLLSKPALTTSTSTRFFHASLTKQGITIPVASSSLKTKFDLPDPADRSQDGARCRNSTQLTKIIATIGPTSEQQEPLRQVTAAGMRIMRLNFSHATVEEVELRTKNLALAQVRQVGA